MKPAGRRSARCNRQCYQSPTADAAHEVDVLHERERAKPTKSAVEIAVNYLRLTGRKPGQFLFAGRGDRGGLTTRQYARLVLEWIASIGLDPAKFGTHSLRRTKAVLIYRRTGNLRAVQLLLGHSKIESTVRYLGIEVDDAIEIAEKIDI